MLGKYSKAIIAVVGTIATALLTLSTSPELIAVLPESGGQWLATAAGVVGTGVLGWLIRNQLTVDQIDKAIDAGDISLSDLRALLKRFDAQ